MGHQFPRAAVAAAVALALVACGGGAGEAGPPPVLDNARDQVAAADRDGSAVPASSGLAETAATGSEPAELPAPDPSTFVGANRVVNLWVGAAGDTVPIDVWGRRTFTNAPILLAEDIEFAAASGYFAAPPDYELVVVGAGAGPDGTELAGLANTTTDEQITTVFTNDDTGGTAATIDLVERGTAQALLPPSDGAGLVVVVAPNIEAFSDRLRTALGDDSFSVGDGSAVCRTQRGEAEGFPPDVLGDGRLVELEMSPGRATISLHPSPDEECERASVLDLEVEVTAGATELVFVYSRDGSGLDALVLPAPGPTG